MNARILLVGPKMVHFQAMIEGWGMEVSCAATGEQGLQHLQQESSHLVLFDLSVSNPTAADFAQQAMQTQDTVQLLLIEETSKAGQILKVIQQGAHSFLAAPPSESDLYTKVAKLAGQFAQQGMSINEHLLLQEQLQQAHQQISEFGMQNNLLQQEIESLRQTDMSGANLDSALIQYQVENAALLNELETYRRQEEMPKEATQVTLSPISEEETRRLRKESKRQSEQIDQLETELEEALKERDLAQSFADSAKSDIVQLERVLAEKLSQLSEAHLETENIAEQQEATHSVIKDALEESETARASLSSQLANAKRAVKKAKEERAYMKLECEESALRLSYWESRAKKAEHILRKLSLEQALRKKKSQKKDPKD